MGICRLPTEAMYWSHFYCPAYFPQTMTHNRSKQMSKYLHFVNRRSIPKGNTNRLIHIHAIMEYLQQKCRTLYIPLKQLSIDEGTLAFKG